MSTTSKLPLISLEWFSSVKEFFDAYPAIPADELFVMWWNKSKCGSCTFDINGFKNCDHRNTVGYDYPDMIVVLEWNFNDQIFLDVSCCTTPYSKRSQYGYIYCNNVPIMKNKSMNLSLVYRDYDKASLIDFRRIRNAAFGYYISYDENGKSIRCLKFSDWETEDGFVKFADWMLEIRQCYKKLEDMLRNSYNNFLKKQNQKIFENVGVPSELK